MPPEGPSPAPIGSTTPTFIARSLRATRAYSAGARPVRAPDLRRDLPRGARPPGEPGGPPARGSGRRGRPVVAGPPLPDARARPDDHPRRRRGPRGRHDGGHRRAATWAASTCTASSSRGSSSGRCSGSSWWAGSSIGWASSSRSSAGCSLFALGLLLAGIAPSMQFLIGARLIQGIGGGAIPPVAYVAIGRSLPGDPCDRGCSRCSRRPGSCRASSGRRSPASWPRTFHWRLVFLGLLPLILVSGTIAVRALVRLPEAHRRADRLASIPSRRGPRRRSRGCAHHDRAEQQRAGRHRRPRDPRRAHHARRPEAAHPAWHATARPWLSIGGPAARDPDLRVLLGRRLRGPPARRRARLVGGRRRGRADLRDRDLDGGQLGPGEALGPVPARAVRASRLPVVGLGLAGLATVLIPAVPAEWPFRPSAWRASGWA